MVESYKTSQKIGTFLKYLVLIVVGLIMIYPLIWMVGATFKHNSDIFTSVLPFTSNPTLEGYQQATKLDAIGTGVNIWQSMINTYKIVLPKVIFTVFSATITAYGFGRFNFVGKKLFFALMMGTLFLPQVVMNVPQFLMYHTWGWVDHPLYPALVVHTLFATESYFVFMLVQFLRSVPRELDEAAKIDGCNAWQILFVIICPMLKPAMVSAALFQFMWSSNDFMGPLIYASGGRHKLTPAAIFVKLAIDPDQGTPWSKVLAASLITITPSLIVFFLAQKQFVDGISAGSVKG